MGGWKKKREKIGDKILLVSVWLEREKKNVGLGCFLLGLTKMERKLGGKYS